MTDITLSKDQQLALVKILAWFRSTERPPFITLGGYAGTGKTTLISILRERLEGLDKKLSVGFCAYTGKATRILQEKLVAAGTLLSKDSVSTIHSLIYSPVTNLKGEIISWERKAMIDANLLIVDEASMIDEFIWNDLLSYKVPIIAVGDHGQLPPIRGNFNLMQRPQIKLEEIHRQAKDNPIIQISIQARTKGTIPYGKFGDHVMKLEKGSSDSQEIVGEALKNFNENTLVLCGYNHTRIRLNKYIRNGLEIFDEDPVPGDRVICLKNNREHNIFNGMMGYITSIEPTDEEHYLVRIDMDDGEKYKGEIYSPQFNATESFNFSNDKSKKFTSGDLFDFGYAITVHKAQGSQAERVILFEERFSKMDDQMWRRWLYTAITRAEKELIIVG